MAIGWTTLPNGQLSHPVWGTFDASRLGGLTPQQIFGTIGDNQSAVDAFNLSERTKTALDELRNADQQFNNDEGAGTAGSSYFANPEWDALLPRDVLDNQTFNPYYDFQNQMYRGLWDQGLAKVMPGDPAVKDWSQVYVDPTYGLVTQHSNASDPSSFFDLVKDFATTVGPFLMPGFMGMTGLGQVLSNTLQAIPGVSEIGSFLSDLGSNITSGLDSLVGDAAAATTTPLPPSAPVTGMPIPDTFPGVTDASGAFGGMSVNPSIPTTATDLLGLPAAPVTGGMSTIPGSLYGTAAPFLPGAATTATAGGVGGTGAVGGGAGGGMSTAELDALTAADPTAAGTSATNAALETVGLGGAAAAGGSTLDSILKNLGTAQGLGTLASTLLGAYGSNQLADSLQGIANQARADREPYRLKSLEYLTNPAAYYSGPIGQETARATANALSANYGNLFDSPSGQATMMQAMVPSYMNSVLGLGNLGLGGQTAIMDAQTNAAKADTNIYNSVGAGLSGILNPQPGIMDILKQMQSMNKGAL